MWLFLVWLVLFFGTSVAVSMLGTQINDEIEDGLAIHDRPSWQGWRVRRVPLAEIRRHREMYPSSRLRKWWAATTICQAGLIIVPFVGAILGGIGSR
jgi:hypothetical protein